ncbi:unnamed protein product [Trifolium pratense]|uniref:Uncharacterized protein n=1 Tax=Trifolium pratense TaxID=57577 RepID=A0ACB0LU41_TRIPR|nr:unnamed protein product [Trifolium pratense]
MGVSNSFHGSKLFLNAQFPEVAHYIERMNVANVELTQVVSQMTGPSVISVADDFLQTQRMTIEDLIESTEDSIEVVDSNNNEETVVPDSVQTPTSKDVGKKPLDLDGVGGSATKEPVVSIEDVDLVNSVEAPTCKPAMEAFGNLDEAHVTTPKQTKMACVIVGYSAFIAVRPHLPNCGIWVAFIAASNTFIVLGVKGWI